MKALLHRSGLIGGAHAVQWDREIVRGNLLALPFESASFEAAYCSHVLEHLYLNEVPGVLLEARRVLKDGGLLRVALPDGVALAAEFAASGDRDPQVGVRFNARLLAQPAERPKPLIALRTLLGGHIHRWQPSFAQIKMMLEEAGFKSIERLSYREGKCPDLAIIETRADSIFLECRA